MKLYVFVCKIKVFDNQFLVFIQENPPFWMDFLCDEPCLSFYLNTGLDISFSYTG